MVLNFLSVFIGGGIGALLRYCVSLACRKFLILPIFGTLTVNLAGCLFIGFLFALFLDKVNNLPNVLKVFTVTGFLGGLTTFSTLNIEVFQFVKEGKILSGLLYLSISCFLGLLFTFLGYCLYSKI